MIRTLAACAIVFFAGALAAAEVTDGFRVLTTEGARRLSIAESPKFVPDARIEDASGREGRLVQSLRDDGRVTIVSFIYTRCNAICSVMGSEFQQLQQAIETHGLGRKVRLLSISFDPQDRSHELSDYGRRMGARSGVWEFASLPEPAQRRAVLDLFGITVIPAPLGEFQHNGAFHIVRPDGLLARIVDYDAPEAALAYAIEESDRAGPTMTDGI